MNHLGIRVEGGLLSPDFLESIHDAPGQRPADFGLARRTSLVDSVTAAWSDARSLWDTFQRRLARARGGSPSAQSESVTTLTREQWVIPLLGELLGYEALTFQRRAAEIDGRTYAISHRAGGQDTRYEIRDTNEERSSELGTHHSELVTGIPIHIVGIDQELGDRPPAGRGRLSAHALVQDYLNRTDEHLWGIVSNGAVLRLLRDSTYFTRPAYIEFDLRAIMEGERLDEFFLLYRLVHRSRLPGPGVDPESCLLEQYHRQTVEQGGRIRDGLRAAVSEAITTLGNGFLRHPRNEDLRAALAGARLSTDGYYSQLLYLIYRLLFLMVAEERGLLEDTKYEIRNTSSDDPSSYVARIPISAYRDHFSVTRLRRLAAEALPAPERFDDLYLGLRTLFTAFHDERMAALLGVPALNGELFSSDKTRELSAAHLSNRELLAAVDQLSHFMPKDEHVRRRVNYAALDVEELGSVYESLLDERPHIDLPYLTGSGTPVKSKATFALITGLERKTTGSYYTPRELVAEVIKSALDPVIGRVTSDGRRVTSSTNPAVEKEHAEHALLSLRVIDPACGSGHFLLAAARRIGLALARARTGADEPPPEAVRAATRDAVTHCLYGVDKNPLAVDLCKVALWIEGHSEGKPLTFLDYKIRCGDSLVGVFDLEALRAGIPDDAYKPLTGDDKPTAAALRKRNKQERGEPDDAGQMTLFFGEGAAGYTLGTTQWAALADWPEDTPEQVQRKQREYNRLHAAEEDKRLAADLWTAAFFTPLTRANASADLIPTSDAVRRAAAGQRVNPALAGHAEATASANRFFHWPLEFPHVFGDGGFDVVLGNPPWEKIKLEEQQFFADRDPEIAGAANKAARARLIKELPGAKPALWRDYQNALRDAEALSNFLRGGSRFTLTARGDINTYAIFTELARELIAADGRAGIVVPTGIATDSTTSTFFGDLVARGALAELKGFENEAFIFPAVHNAFKFCVLAMTGPGRSAETDFVFFCRYFYDLTQEERHFRLAPADFAAINPNTLTTPVFRTRSDAELTKKIYRRVPVLENEGTGENPWGVKFQTLFHMSNDSNLFRVTSEESTPLLPLYEAKMMHQFDHRFSTYENATQADINAGRLPQTGAAQKADPYFAVRPRYWVEAAEVEARLREWKRGWLLGFRRITSAVVERTAIFSLLPRVGSGDPGPLLLPKEQPATLCACLLANFNSLVLDFIARQKVGGTHMDFFAVKQLPVLPPTRYAAHDLRYIVPRVLELVYTAWDMASFAADVWAEAEEDLRGTVRNYELGIRNEERGTGAAHSELVARSSNLVSSPPPFPPFKWDDTRRARLRAELDAYYARLYGLTRDELRYILDPADVHGPEFPGETFRVLKEKEMKAYGEYRTGRLVLEAWDSGSLE